MTYLVHPGTAVYVGYTDGYDNVALDPGRSSNFHAAPVDIDRTSVLREVELSVPVLRCRTEVTESAEKIHTEKRRQRRRNGEDSEVRARRRASRGGVGVPGPQTRTPYEARVVLVSVALALPRGPDLGSGPEPQRSCDPRRLAVFSVSPPLTPFLL